MNMTCMRQVEFARILGISSWSFLHYSSLGTRIKQNYSFKELYREAQQTRLVTRTDVLTFDDYEITHF